jgi:hypothetical protein
MHAENPAKEAGRTFGINPRTVDFHSANLLKKLALGMPPISSIWCSKNNPLPFMIGKPAF